MPRSPDTIGFAEFVRRKGDQMRPAIAKAFETELRTNGGASAFNYRTADDWEHVLAEFHTADRRRRS